MSRQPVFRFAPSPNGELHLGHAYSVLVTAEMAARHGGRLLLRIEDIDVGRSRPEFEARILDDLAWLGLEWEEPVRRQSEHFATYAKALAKLEALGVVYACFATRRQIADRVAAAGPKNTPRDPEGAPIYPGLHRDLGAAEVASRKALGEPYALRLDMDRALAAARRRGPSEFTFKELSGDGSPMAEQNGEPERWGDVVIARKDVPTSYHLAVVVDDALQGVTHVTRGQDLFAATGLHRLLQRLLGLPEPLYHHHTLIMDAEDRKLSKRHKDLSLRSLREAGAAPGDIRRMIGRAL